MFGSNLSKFDSAMFTSAATYFRDALKLNDSHIPIEVLLVDNIGKGTCAGTCQAIIEKQELTGLKIEIKSNATTIGMIEALAHEMVHAKQWVKGETTFEIEKKYLFGIFPYFKVKKFWKGADVTNWNYYDLPYEQEAHILQKYMTFNFLKATQVQIDPTTLLGLLTNTDSNK